MSSQTKSMRMDPSLYEAAEKGDVEAFDDHRNNLDHLLTPIDNTILHIHISAQSETIPESTDFVEKILDLCPSLSLKVNTKGETPLHMAAKYNRCGTVKVLIKCAKDLHRRDLERGRGESEQLVTMTNKKKDTALHEAVRFNHLDVVKLLIEEDRHFSYSSNDAGETPLYLAAERGFDDVVKEILNTWGLSSPHSGPNALTALHASVIRNHRGITRDILDKKEADITKEADQQGWTPLHYAAFWDHDDMVKLLLADDISAAYLAADRDGNKTALHIAASRGNYNIVKMLISRCPACWELVDVRGWNFFHFAAESNNVERLLSHLDKRDNIGNTCLLRLGASMNNLLNEKDNDGNTPLHLFLASTSDLRNIHWITEDGRVDKMGFNNKNLNATDIIFTNDKLHDKRHLKWLRPLYNKRHLKRQGLLGKSELISYFHSAGARSGQRNITAYNDDREKNEPSKDRELYWKEIKQAKNSHLIVAILIATVTFAAGFTLPGGYISDKGDDQGTPILSKKVAFNVFILFDTLAMVLSVSAVVLHLSLAMLPISPLKIIQVSFEKTFFLAFYLTQAALSLMVQAFIMGLFAVLEDSSAIAFLFCAVAYLIFTCLSVHKFFILGKNIGK